MSDTKNTVDGRRALFMACYADEYQKRVKEQRDLFSYARTGLRYSESEVESSVRAHAAEIHVDATRRAARAARKALKRNRGAHAVPDGADVEATAADFKRRTDSVHDARLWGDIVDIAGEWGA